MEPGLRALLHANQPGLLPSFLPSLPLSLPPSLPPPACLPRSLLLAGRMASPTQSGPSAADSTTPGRGGNPERVPVGRRGGAGSTRGDLAGWWVSVVDCRPRPRCPGCQEPVSMRSRKGQRRGGSSSYTSCGFFMLTSRLPLPRRRTDDSRQRRAVLPGKRQPTAEAPGQARKGEGNAELCQLLTGSRGCVALLALHSH